MSLHVTVQKQQAVHTTGGNFYFLPIKYVITIPIRTIPIPIPISSPKTTSIPMGIPWEWEFPFPCTPLQLRSSSRRLLVVPCCRLSTTARRAFSVVGLWCGILCRTTCVILLLAEIHSNHIQNVYVRFVLAYTAH